MDVWVLYRDHGCYSDWGRDLLGVYATLDAAQAGAAAFHAAYPTRATFGGWAFDESDHADALDARARGLGAWTRATKRRPDDAEAAPEPLERWIAQPASVPGAPRIDDDVDFVAERWAVQG